jgi:chemotaxis protein CheD
MGSPSIAALFAQRVVVGVGDMSVSNISSFTLSTYALGSCVGVAVYDPMAKAGGLLHMMLPDSSISRAKAGSQPAMFADTGLPLLFRSLQGLRGVDLNRVKLMVAGGSSVLCATDQFRIGERNIKATNDWLAKQGYYVRHTSLGGTASRTLHLDIGSGTVTLKMTTSTDTYSLAG